MVPHSYRQWRLLVRTHLQRTGHSLHRLPSRLRSVLRTSRLDQVLTRGRRTLTGATRVATEETERGVERKETGKERARTKEKEESRQVEDRRSPMVVHAPLQMATSSAMGTMIQRRVAETLDVPSHTFVEFAFRSILYMHVRERLSSQRAASPPRTRKEGVFSDRRRELRPHRRLIQVRLVRCMLPSSPRRVGRKQQWYH